MWSTASDHPLVRSALAVQGTGPVQQFLAAETTIGALVFGFGLSYQTPEGKATLLDNNFGPAGWQQKFLYNADVTTSTESDRIFSALLDLDEIDN